MSRGLEIAHSRNKPTGIRKTEASIADDGMTNESAR